MNSQAKAAEEIQLKQVVGLRRVVGLQQVGQVRAPMVRGGSTHPEVTAALSQVEPRRRVEQHHRVERRHRAVAKAAGERRQQASVRMRCAEATAKETKVATERGSASPLCSVVSIS